MVLLKFSLFIIFILMISCNHFHQVKNTAPIINFIEYANAMCNIKYRIMPFKKDSIVLINEQSRWCIVCRAIANNIEYEGIAEVDNKGFSTISFKLSLNPIYYKATEYHSRYELTSQFKDSLIYSDSNEKIMNILPYNSKIYLPYDSDSMKGYYHGFEKFLHKKDDTVFITIPNHINPYRSVRLAFRDKTGELIQAGIFGFFPEKTNTNR